MTPIPTPNTTPPRCVTGEVTISVAMKNAPIITPPVSRWNIGPGVNPGLARFTIQTNTVIVTKIASGIWQWITRSAIRAIPPIRIASAEVSPRLPPTLPRKAFQRKSHEL